eukprot:3087829-Prymnesium_polylepis.1
MLHTTVQPVMPDHSRVCGAREEARMSQTVMAYCYIIVRALVLSCPTHHPLRPAPPPIPQFMR